MDGQTIQNRVDREDKVEQPIDMKLQYGDEFIIQDSTPSKMDKCTVNSPSKMEKETFNGDITESKLIEKSGTFFAPDARYLRDSSLFND